MSLTLEDISILENSEIIYALGVSAATYAFLGWFTKHHLSSTAKEELSLWLLGAYKSDWSHHYRNQFDSVFGTNHLSFRCFFRSCLASIVSVAFVYYLLFGFSTGFKERVTSEHDIYSIIILGIFVNLIPDYISLYQTRYTLKLLSRFSNIAVHTIVLLFDLAVTAIIFTIYISILGVLYEFEGMSVVSMVAFFSIYSVFFYTTFLTSIWAWFYCVSAWTMRWFIALRLHKLLDVWGKPEFQIALIISVYVFAATAFFPKVFSKDELLKANRFDVALCNWFPDDACPHLLRFSDDDKELFAAKVQLCRQGSEANAHCAEAGATYADAGEVGEAIRLWEVGCNKGDPESCLYKAQETNLYDLFQRSCDLKYATGCYALGRYELEHLEEWQWEEKSFSSFAAGCNLGSKDSCAMVGWSTRIGAGTTEDRRKAHSIFLETCEQGSPIGCFEFARDLEYGSVSIPQRDRAVAAYSRSCQLGIDQGCAEADDLSKYLENELLVDRTDEIYENCIVGSIINSECLEFGVALYEGRELRKNPVRSFELFLRLCSKQYGDGCFWLARSYQLGKGTKPNTETARDLISKSCQYGSDFGCKELPYFTNASRNIRYSKIYIEYLNELRIDCEKGDEHICSVVAEHDRRRVIVFLGEPPPYYRECPC